MSDHAGESQLGPVAGVLLAGGQSRRMGGGDKCLRPLGGQPILARIIETVVPQVSRLVINANGDPDRFASFGVPVAADTVDGYAGPLAGVLTGMEWVAANASECTWIATFATDAPFLPDDLVERLPIPWEAAFLAGKCFVRYRRRGGARRSPLPDFFIGAHAAVANLPLVTRDATRYRTYFPTVQLIAPS